MYYFKARGIECSCDTADELLSVLDKQMSDSNPSPFDKITQRIRVEVVDPSAGSEVEKPVAEKPKSRRKHRRKTAKPVNVDPNAIKDLPYLEGGLDWNVTKKMAKKLKRTDLMQLRSDLFQRQKLGK